MEKAPADYIHSSGDTPPPRLSARSLHAVCTLSAQICTNLHEIYTNLHLSELDKAGSGSSRPCTTFPAAPSQHMSDLLEYSSRIRIVHVSDYSEYE